MLPCGRACIAPPGQHEGCPYLSSVFVCPFYQCLKQSCNLLACLLISQPAIAIEFLPGIDNIYFWFQKHGSVQEQKYLAELQLRTNSPISSSKAHDGCWLASHRCRGD